MDSGRLHAASRASTPSSSCSLLGDPLSPPLLVGAVVCGIKSPVVPVCSWSHESVSYSGPSDWFRIDTRTDRCQTDARRRRWRPGRGVGAVTWPPCQPRKKLADAESKRLWLGWLNLWALGFSALVAFLLIHVSLSPDSSMRLLRSAVVFWVLC